MKNSVSSKIQYINELYGSKDQVLEAIRKSAPKEKSYMQVSQFKGSILKFFVQLINAKLIIEIGTFVGYSAAYMAKGLGDGGKILSVEKNLNYFEIAKDNIAKYSLNKKITVINEDGNTFLESRQQQEKVDMIFIDGKKIEYCDYLARSIDIIRHGGIIVADNTLLFDNVYKEMPQKKQEALMWQKMRKFNKEVANNKIFQTIIFPTNSGLTIALKK